MNSSDVKVGALYRYDMADAMALMWTVAMTDFGWVTGLKCLGGLKSVTSGELRHPSDDDVATWLRIEQDNPHFKRERTGTANSYRGLVYVSPSLPPIESAVEERRAPPAPEAEHARTDGTTRKDHYGAGRQPWDDIVDARWGAPFAAGNVLKYMRRNKDVTESRIKGGWYWRELYKLCHVESRLTDFPGNAQLVMNDLVIMLNQPERDFLAFFTYMTDAEMREAITTGQVHLPA